MPCYLRTTVGFWRKMTETDGYDIWRATVTLPRRGGDAQPSGGLTKPALDGINAAVWKDPGTRRGRSPAIRCADGSVDGSRRMDEVIA